MGFKMFNRKCNSTTDKVKHRVAINTEPEVATVSNINLSIGVDLKQGYRIFTKDDYVKYMLEGQRAENISSSYIESIHESWDKLSKGYKFIIAVGQEGSLMFYSVDYFNDNILNRSNSDG